MRWMAMECAGISTGTIILPAVRLYESIGFQAVNKSLDFVKSG